MHNIRNNIIIRVFRVGNKKHFSTSQCNPCKLKHFHTYFLMDIKIKICLCTSTYGNEYFFFILKPNKCLVESKTYRNSGVKSYNN